MPVVIDEVVVSVETGRNPEGGSAATAGSGGSIGSGSVDRQALVAEVVERVMDLLRQKGER